MDNLEALKKAIADYKKTQGVTAFLLTPTHNTNGPGEPETYESPMKLTYPDGTELPSNYIKHFSNVLTEFAVRINTKVLEASKLEAKSRITALRAEVASAKLEIDELDKL